MEQDYLKIHLHQIQNQVKYQDVIVLNYVIFYPQFLSTQSQPFINRLNDLYKQRADQLARYCENTLTGSAIKLYHDSILHNFPFHSFQFYSKYFITYNENCTLSLYFDQYQYEGGANGASYRHSDTWSIKEERKMYLKDFFPKTFDYLTYLQEDVSSDIKKQIETQQYYYFDNYESLVGEYFRPDQFYLTDEALVIYFQEITIAPHSSGFPTFSFNYDDSEIVEPTCFVKESPSESIIDPYKVRSELLMSATDTVGVFTSVDAANVWAKGLKERSAALQYIVILENLKKSILICWINILPTGSPVYLAHGSMIIKSFKKFAGMMAR